MKLSVPRSSAYNLASGTQSGAGTGDGEGREGREGSATRRFTTIAHNVVCSQRDLTEIFIVPLPLCLCPLVSLFPPRWRIAISTGISLNLERETCETPLLVCPLENDTRRGKLFFKKCDRSRIEEVAKISIFARMREQNRVNKFSQEERKRNNYYFIIVEVNMLNNMTESEFVLILPLELEQASIYLDFNL